jgi:hypothetical protein
MSLVAEAVWMMNFQVEYSAEEPTVDPCEIILESGWRMISVFVEYSTPLPPLPTYHLLNL